MSAIQNKKCRSYWKKTSASESLFSYINMDFDGLQEIITRLTFGEEVEVDVDDFVSIHAMAIFCQSSHSDIMSVICTLNFTLKILQTECFVCATAYFCCCQDAVTL